MTFSKNLMRGTLAIRAQIRHDSRASAKDGVQHARARHSARSSNQIGCKDARVSLRRCVVRLELALPLAQLACACALLRIGVAATRPRIHPAPRGHDGYRQTARTVEAD